MYLLRLIFSILKYRLQAAGDSFVLGIYGPTYIVDHPDHFKQADMPHVINIYQPDGEPDVMVRLIFSHRGEVDKVIDCKMGRLIIADLPWNGTLYGHFTRVPTDDMVSDSITCEARDIIIGKNIQGKLVVIIGGDTHLL